LEYTKVDKVMKIMFVTSSSIQGGAQKHIKDMFILLSKKGNDVYLVAPNGWLVEELEEYREKLHIINSSIKNVSALRKILESIKPDIINTFILSGGCFGYAAWLKKKYGKIFITVNNPVIYDGISLKARFIYPVLYRWMSKGARAFLTKSYEVKKEVENVIKNKKPVIAIKNAIDFKKYDYNRLSTKNKSKKIIVSVGALEERKGHRYLIEAMKSVVNDYNDVECWIVGEGSIKNDLLQLISEYGMDDNIKLLGKRNDVNVILGQADIFVLPSLHEGLPNALMEAMAMKLACIATNVGGVSELIYSSELGIVVKPKSSQEIYQAIIRCISEDKYAERIADNAYKCILNQYEENKVVDELKNIYLTI